MKVTVKRFEGPYVVCVKEDGGIIDIKRINVPKDTREGCILNIIDDKYTILYEGSDIDKKIK